MASIRRERLFSEYRKRMSDAKRKFNISSILLLIPSAGLFLSLTIYYFIRVLAMLAGGNMYMGQIILNYATGNNDEIPLKVVIPFLFLFYLFGISLLTLLMRLFKLKKINYLLILIYLGTFIYGFITLLFSSISIVHSILYMVYAIYGIWLEDIVLRQHKEFKLLSEQEGYPDFIDIIGEPVPISNTSGIYLRQYEQLKEERKKSGLTNVGINDSCVDINEHLVTPKDGGIPSDAMDELTTDFNQSIDELLKKAK